MSKPVTLLKAASLTALTAAMLSPLPALARESARDAGLNAVQDRLGDPATQQAVGDALAGMVAAMLDLKAAPFVKAMDSIGQPMGQGGKNRTIPDGATLGDLAGPEARRAPAQMARQVPQMMGAMGAMTGVMQEMLPQLEDIGRRMGDQMGKSIERAERRDGKGE